MKMMALEEAKEYTRQKLAPYYSKNVGLMELYL